MHALGFLADGVAHDLANPLGAILGLASLIAADERVPDDLRTDARLLREEADRTYRLVSTLLDVTRIRPPVLRPTAVAPTVTSLLELATHPLAGVTVEVAIASDLPEVEVDPSAFRNAIAGLLVDATGAPRSSLGPRPVVDRGRRDGRGPAGDRPARRSPTTAGPSSPAPRPPPASARCSIAWACR